MGQRNMHMTDLESDQQGQGYIHPEPCVFYGAMTNYPQPNVHTVVPAPGNASNFNLHHLPEHHEGAIFYGMTQYNQYPAANLNLAVASSSNPYNPYMAPPSAPRDFPIPVNHGTYEQLSFSSTFGVAGVPADSYGRTIPHTDGVRGSFKRKTDEGLPWNFQYCDALAGSSSVVPISSRPLESDVTLTDAVPFAPPEYGGNETSAISESGSHRSVRNSSAAIGQDSVLAHNSNHLVQGSYVGQPYQLPGSPWLGLDINNVTWNQASTLPYLHGSMNGGCVEVSNMGLQSYQVTGNRSSTGFLHASFPQGHPGVVHPPPPMQGVRGQTMNFSSPVVTSSHRFSTNSTTLSPFQGVVEAGPRYTSPVPPTGFRIYRPHRREVTPELNTRHRNLPHLRVLPEDGVAILELPGYHEAGDPMDQHRDMRLDIDHMSYEELLALGEQIGNVGTGLPEEAITNNLKTRSFTSSATCSVLDEAASMNQEVDFCVICQTDYKDQEMVGTLDCGHEYHVDCIKKWLVVKNTCPICKSAALTAGGNNL
ncbi:hypothetical protein ACH5RR_028122 [Cinchona calisaya]|uniref:RING-type E3 ubiquitin transferase n=1 Tax=Cinchona calisaya TaxID=153742 RepID=A0ABD2YQ08_9GENT